MKQLLLLFAFLAYSFFGFSQCLIVPSIKEGCIPSPATFRITNSTGKTITDWNWDFGDGSNSTQPNPTHVYAKRGIFSPQLIITLDDGSKCTAKSGNTIQIYDNPIPVVSTPKKVKLCFDYPLVKMEEKSKPGADGAPIVGYLWDFGDGTINKNKSAWHQFPNDGLYNVVLEVLDLNGCKDTAIHKLDVSVYNQLNFDLRRNGLNNCPTTKVNFLNKTDSNGWDIKKVKWDFGDSSWQEATKGDANWSDTWNGPSHTYTKDGQFSVWLVVENINGCKDSIEQFNIENVVFEFDPSVSPKSAVCFDQPKGGNAFVFSQPYVNNAQVFWDFGDPSNLGTGWSMAHLFETPGYYSVNLKIKKGGCIRDTTLCGVVHIQGPVAKIQRNASYRNDSVPDYQEMPSSFPHPVEICQGKPLEYYTLDTVSIKVPHLTYCNADTLSKRAYAQTLKCQGYVPKFDYKLKPTTVADAVENVVLRKKHFYHPDTPVVKPVYSPKTGTHFEGNMHDTSLYAPHCSAPHTVNFLNNSIKFRRYDATDNFPGIGIQDICLNPTYPYASDSLNYIWNFGDKHAKACTSSTISPDPFCAYSTERLPKHTYTVDGCYKTFLIARDPETGCENRDSIIITLEAPNASWDSVAITEVDKMDFDAQKRVGLGRRGIIIEGPKCVGYVQEIIIDELLPACGPDYFWIMPDSAAQTKVEYCGGDTLIRHNWLSADMIKGVDYRYAYADTGWKTVGVVVKSGSCFDTFWYNKYKYMYHVEPEIIADKDYICPGDSFTVRLLDTTQEGISHLYFTYAFKHDYLDPDSIIKVDTVDFISITDTAGNTTDITSTIYNYSTGLKDSFFYNNLSQTSTGVGPKPGHVIVSAHISHRLTCSGTYELDIAMGHQAEFKTRFKTYCIGDSIEFLDSVRYFAPFESSQYTGVKDIDYWADPLSGRQNLPQFPEEIEWDFDGDGIIDHKGANPKHAYTEPGTYSVHMYTKDSFNCGWQVLKKTNFIKVVSLDADFGVINDDTSRFCAPQFFEFEERSTILQPNKLPRDTIVRWKWKWGDGARITLTNLPNGKVGRSYRHNGDFRVFMRAELATYDSTKGAGCIDTQSHVVHIEGPRPRFKLLDSVGCEPYTARVLDLTKRASVWEWSLGNGATKPSYGADTIDLHYDKAGIFCLGLAAGDTIRDLFDSTFYCIDDYPHSPCKFSVEVKPIDPIAIDYDTLICVKQLGNFNLGRSDSLYSRFIIDYGDGVKESRDDSLYQHAYAEMGKYKVEFTGESPCPDTGQVMLNVIGIEADFEIDQTRLDTPTFWFINTSSYGEDYEWFFGNNTNFRDQSKELSYAYNSPGKKEVCLVAYNILGCPDTVCKDLEIITDLFIPNVFTPQGDKQNPTFEIMIKGETKYELVIFNRWGERVFESKDKNYQWNGKRFNNGALCNTGTYYFVFNYQILGEEAKKVAGTVTLLR